MLLRTLLGANKLLATRNYKTATCSFIVGFLVTGSNNGSTESNGNDSGHGKLKNFAGSAVCIETTSEAPFLGQRLGRRFKMARVD